MDNYLQRDQAPFSSGQWAKIDGMVVQTASSSLVGRRFLSLVGPFGPGVEALPYDIVGGTGEGQIDLLGNRDDEAVQTERRQFLPLPLLYKDFVVHWRDLESQRHIGLPLDTGKAAAAAAAVANAEDHLVFRGDESLGLAGLSNVSGRQVVPMGDWSSAGAAFADVVNGVRALTQHGFTGPYALIVSPRLYAELNRVFNGTGVLELEQIEKLARRGVYPTSVLPKGSALLVDSGAQNMDLSVGVDISTAYVESANLNHRLRVLESLVLRVRRPGAVCSFEAGSTASRVD